VTVVSLADSVDAEAYGGKAAQLAIAIRAGLPVPPGVALSVDLVEALAAGDPAASAELARVWALVHPPVAVRSSAVGEDSAGASFAGQHATYLNVRAPEALGSTIRAVRDSAHAAAALAYRRRLGLDEAPRLAVVVQALVKAECAGVLFTRNPIDGANELVIEASWGLGEAVVAGLVTPDRFRVTYDGAVLERVAGEKDVAVNVSPEGGTSEIAVEPPRARSLCLSDAQLEELRHLARSCEEAFGAARDLEWAYAGERLYLLQSRAMTRVPV
jgi:pyruvate,water dikinase